MAEENKPSLGGFEAISSMLTGGSLTDDDTVKTSVNEPPIVDPSEIKKRFTELENEEEEDETNEETESDEEDDESKEESKQNKSSKEETEDEENLDEYEEDIMAFLNTKLSEQLGWELEGDDTPKSVEELVDFMRELVQEGSKPRYASEEVEKYDEFAKNGGSLREFYSTLIENRVDTESINMDSEYDQKRVIREHYKNQGYNEERINKMISRYEDAGILEESATDALELLKEYNQKAEQKLLDDQKKKADAALEQQQNFIDSVQESIKSLKNVRGISISDTERTELLDYILTPGKDGMTQYQKDYMKDIKNLLESAYFTKKGDALLAKVKKQGESDAVKNLHEKLKTKKGNTARKGGNQGGSEASSGLSVFSSILQGS